MLYIPVAQTAKFANDINAHTRRFLTVSYPAFRGVQGERQINTPDATSKHV